MPDNTITQQNTVLLKMNKLLVQATTQMKLENIMLNENTPDTKGQCCVIPFIRNVHDRQIHRQKVSWYMLRRGKKINCKE